MSRIPKPPVVIIESNRGDSGYPSVPPNPSDPRGLKSLGPIAASMPPLRSLFPSKGESPQAKRTRLVAVGVLTAGLGLVAVLGFRHGTGGHTTKPLITEIASGRAGVRTTPSGAEEHWTKAMPPSFVLDPSLDKIGPAAKAAIAAAFTTWDTANLGLPQASFFITNTAGAAAKDGVSRIVYAPITTAGFEDALAITIAYAEPDSGAIAEADVIINSKYTFGVLANGTNPACASVYDVQDVITHEAGHVYGLGEDYSNTTTTMYVSSEKCETHKRELSPGDTQAMSALYTIDATSTSTSTSTSPSAAATTAPAAASCGSSTVASRNPSSRSFLWGLGALMALGVSRRARRRPRAS